ncbi:hypothetical protein K2Y00_01875 [Patescibacteria group bacterium]|nr:hypothetical protein [Patescibacteria group bacterium]
MSEVSRVEARAPASTFPAPDWWVETKEAPPAPEYVRFQVFVAKRLSEQTGAPFVKVLHRFTSAIETFVEGTVPEWFNTASVDTVTHALVDQYKTQLEKMAPQPYHPEGSFRFGCFNSEYDPEEQAVTIHFQNDERDATGPLTEEKIYRRRRELRDMFTLIRRLYPDAKTVNGNSWLYNLEAYRRLFPESYTSHLTLETSAGVFSRGRQIWGQFLDHTLRLKSDDARREFIQNLYALGDSITDQDLMKLFPLKSYKAEGAIEDFYRMYGVEGEH